MESTAAFDGASGEKGSEDKRVISLVNRGTNTATPKGAAKSRKSPYVPVPSPALSGERFDNTIFIKIVALAPRPNPRIPRADARMKNGVVIE